jgi:hypothetical protein
MKAATSFFTVLMVLAIAQILTKALGFALLIVALLGAIAAPRQTFGLVALLGLLTLAQKKPAYCIAAIGAIGVAIVISNRLQTRPDQPEPLFLPRHGD